jgi:hypothetical protein
MTSPAQIEHALERLRESAQKAPLPDLDSASIERRVLAEVGRSEVSSAFIAVQRRRWPTWFGIGIAAAASLLIATHQLKPNAIKSAKIPSRGQLDQQPGIDGRSFELQTPIVATNYDITVKHPKLATWRLMAPGQARIVSNDPGHVTIALDSGRIEADVIRQPKPESFAIEVANARIAVHGTLFSVERRGALAEVVVREGQVMVSQSNATGSLQNTLLTAPSRAQVDLEPQALPDTEPGKDRPSGILSPSPRLSADTTNTRPSPALPETPEADELERTWAETASIVSVCFAEHTAKTPSVRVSFKTLMTVHVGVSGAIAQIGFNPPVPESVRECTLTRVGGIKTNPSLNGATLSRATVLSR